MKKKELMVFAFIGLLLTGCNNTNNTQNYQNNSQQQNDIQPSDPNNNNAYENYDYEIGNEISIIVNGREEPFYVIKSSKNTDSTVTLFAKQNINELATGQIQSTTFKPAFASESYWLDRNASSYKVDLDVSTVKGNVEGDAISLAQNYATYVGGNETKGRLLTFEEEQNLYVNYPNILYNGENYWMGSTYGDYYLYIYFIDTTLKSLEFKEYYTSNVAGIRPVIIIPKTLLNNN